MKIITIKKQTTKDMSVQTLNQMLTTALIALQAVQAIPMASTVEAELSY